MTVTFYSNYLNHHQIPFCNAMYNLLGDGYTFVETEPMEDERCRQGWAFDETYPYHLKSYQSAKCYERSIKLATDSDITIHGSAPEIYIKTRVKTGKPAFRYSERVFKKGYRSLLNPRTVRAQLILHTKYRNYPLYMLCASAYAAGDFALVGAYKNKTYKWGYFPKVEKLDTQELAKAKSGNPATELLWCGRSILFKKKERAIFVAKRLRDDGYSFNMNTIGDGELEGDIKKLVAEYGLEKNVKLLGAMPPEKVREYMKKADIYLVTSNFEEGWGAVMNESMSSGCAVVASHAIGSVPFLVEHGKNGLIYEYGNDDDLYSNVKKLMDDAGLRHKLGENAYLTLRDTWNAEVAADRLLGLLEGLLGGKPPVFDSGPCSAAEPIGQWQMHRRAMSDV